MQLEPSQPQVAVALLVEQPLTERFAVHRHAGCALESHRYRRQPPVRGAGNAARRLVVFLMTRGAPGARSTSVIGSAYNAELVDVSVVPLARIVGSRVAVDTSRMREDGFDDPPVLPGGGRSHVSGCPGRRRRCRRIGLRSDID